MYTEYGLVVNIKMSTPLEGMSLSGFLAVQRCRTELQSCFSACFGTIACVLVWIGDTMMFYSLHFNSTYTQDKHQDITAV